MTVNPDRPSATDDASYQAAGGEDGIRKLVDAFFDRMGSDPRFATIYAMHPEDKDVSRDKLACFLCGWLGGPKLYHEKDGAIGIPRVHAHLAQFSSGDLKISQPMAQVLQASPHQCPYPDFPGRGVFGTGLYNQVA